MLRNSVGTDALAGSVAQPPVGPLAFTGIESQRLAITALTLVAAGIFLVATTRRRNTEL